MINLNISTTDLILVIILGVAAIFLFTVVMFIITEALERLNKKLLENESYNKFYDAMCKSWRIIALIFFVVICVFTFYIGYSFGNNL